MTMRSRFGTALSFLSTTMSGRNGTDERSGLPNVHAMLAAARLAGRSHIAVARIKDMATISAVLGTADAGLLTARIAERLALGTESGRIYHVNDAVLGWLVPPGTEDELPGRFEALQALLNAPVRLPGRNVDVAVTFGMCTSDPDASGCLSNAMVAAERALAGGARWQSFNRDDEGELARRISLLGELDRAIDAGQVWVAYQPKLDCRTGLITGAEALVRWLHPTRGAIRPDQFIPLAEQSGRIAKLTRHVLDVALGDFATLTSGSHRPRVAVNLSTTLLATPELVSMVCDALWRNGVFPDQLMLEITESAAMSGDERAQYALDRFRSMGIGISIDDYGTGQSTLAYLKRLPATELKIDQSFIRAMTDSRSDEILVTSTIELGHQLGLDVVAEGVETREILDRLIACGCDVIQGYFIGKPMPFNDFARLYRDPWPRYRAA